MIGLAAMARDVRQGPRTDALARPTWVRRICVAGLAIAAAVALRTVLETFGDFYYLPMIPAVMATALLADRQAVALAILLSTGFNLVVVHRLNVVDAAVNAALFAVVAWGIAEVCQRLIEALARAQDLARDLTARQALLDAILGSTPVVTVDRAGTVRRITPAAAALLGEDPDAVTGRPFADWVAAFDLETLSALEDGGRLGTPPDGHWTAVKANGDVVPMTLQAALLPDQAAPEHIVVSLADQGESEAARKRARDLQTQLEQVWRLNSLGQMAATLAHELNQPLTAAAVYLHAGHADVVRSGPLGDSAGRNLDLAKTQILRAGEIIRRMRDLIATGSRSFSREHVQSMIDDLSPVFSLISRDSDVPIRCEIDADDLVVADRVQVQQALTNLVRNAVDAVGGQSGGAVAVTGRSFGVEGYELTVEDNGPGIPEAERAHVFQPMATTKSGGMGLGLSVTRAIVESHGGQLVVGRSAQGGAAFSFRLPRTLEAAAA